MRVLLLTDADVFAGTERHMLELATELRAFGQDVTIGCPGHGPLAERARAAGVPVISIAKVGMVDWRAARQIAAAIRAGQIDLIHAHNGRSALVAAMATWWAGRGKLIATQHFLELSRSSRRGLKAIVSRAMHRWVERRVDRFVAISQAVRSQMLARGDCEEAKITVVLNGIVPPERRDRATVERIRAEFGVTAGAPFIVCASRLQQEKNVPGLVDAMSSVRAAHPQVVCVVAGAGDQETAVRQRIDELGLAGCVHLAGFRSDVLDLIAACDLFVLPSFAEPFGLVLLEAMALGKAVVATAAGGPREIVEDGETGRLVKPGDSNALAAGILELLANDHARESMGRSGRARFIEQFTAAQMGWKMIRVYETLIAPEKDSQNSTKTVAIPERA